MHQEERLIEVEREGSIELESLLMELRRQESLKFDIVVRSDKTTIQTEENEIALNFPTITDEQGAVQSREQMQLTEWGHRQLAEKMDIPWKYYERLNDHEHVELLAANVRAWMETKEQRYIRTMGGKVRAILSDKYRKMDHLSVFTAAAERANAYGAKVMKASLTETKMYVKMIVPYRAAEIRTGDVVAPGIVVSNSEVGAGAFRAEMFVMRLLCKNGMIGTGSVARFHLGAKQEAGVVSQETIDAEAELVKNQVRDLTDTVFDEATFEHWVKQLRAGADLGLTNPTNAVSNVIREFKIPEVEQDAILNELISTGDSTQYGLVNAITSVARVKEDADVNIELERIAGKISTMEEAPFVRMVEREVPA